SRWNRRPRLGLHTGQGTDHATGHRATKAPDDLIDPFRAGGFLLKDAAPEERVSAVRLIAAGEALLSPSVTRRVIEEFARTSVPAESRAPELEQLTPRERDVFLLLA